VFAAFNAISRCWHWGKGGINSLRQILDDSSQKIENREVSRNNSERILESLSHFSELKMDEFRILA
jgi:hypothetical protein